MNEKEFIQSVETGLTVSSLNFFQLARKTSLKIALRSNFVRYRYIVRLWMLRECAILNVLLNNYDMIPRRTPSKIFVGLLLVTRATRMLPLKIEKKLREKIITNPYQKQN